MTHTVIHAVGMVGGRYTGRGADHNMQTDGGGKREESQETKEKNLEHSSLFHDGVDALHTADQHRHWGEESKRGRKAETERGRGREKEMIGHV